MLFMLFFSTFLVSFGIRGISFIFLCSKLLDCSTHYEAVMRIDTHLTSLFLQPVSEVLILRENRSHANTVHIIVLMF